VGVKDKLKKSTFFELSGGQQLNGLCIARALIIKPSIFIDG
jgi:ABC-type phosphate transport system ATPase subunit